jgi:hypothetical protein
MGIRMLIPIELWRRRRYSVAVKVSGVNDLVIWGYYFLPVGYRALGV